MNGGAWETRRERSGDDEGAAMRRPPVAPRAGAHPADETLASLLDDEEATAAAAGSAALRAHVAACARCTRRLEELRALRRWLREGAAAEAAPSHDLAHMAAAASPLAALFATAVHTAGYLAVTGLIAWIVYRKVGLSVLRKAWLNVDALWAIALVATGVITFLM